MLEFDRGLFICLVEKIPTAMHALSFEVVLFKGINVHVKSRLFNIGSQYDFGVFKSRQYT